MLIGKIHPGSGLGDQLFSYIVTRVIALDKGYDFGFVGKEFFKGTFMNLDWGVNCDDLKSEWQIEQQSGKLVLNSEVQLFEINKPYYDPEVNFVEDGTIIDGYGAQDIRYFGHRLDEISAWLQFPPINVPDDLCVINFRGGEFSVFPELFLTKEYWDQAIHLIWKKNPKMVFEVHTDDIKLAEKMIRPLLYPSGCRIFQDISFNWRSVLFAKHAIISNSAFAIIPRLLNGGDTIAPRYWARRNIKEWSMPSNYYPKFTYI